MSERYLYVQVNGVVSDINIAGLNRFSAVQDKIKERFPGGLVNVDTPLIQLVNHNNQRINTWALVDSLPKEYFMENGYFLQVVLPMMPNEAPRYQNLPDPQENTTRCLDSFQKPPFAEISRNSKRYFKVQIKPLLLGALGLSLLVNLLQIIYISGLAELLFLSVVVLGFLSVYTENAKLLAYYTWLRLLVAFIEFIFDIASISSMYKPNVPLVGLVVLLGIKYILIWGYLFAVIRFWNAVSKTDDNETRPLVGQV
ncbi:hypothetical protein HDV06_001538 [Boothiomyces sp. JEL0866]|nr:hypothetical protein HDV06_001538 [Boothiomyces sp. JEL0866]